MTDKIASAIRDATAYLKEHPEEASYTDSPAIARLEEGLRCRVVDPDDSVVTTDMPAGVGGGNSAPSPGWLMRAAHASCEATLIAMRAASEGVALTGLEVTVDSESNDYGILGIDEDIDAGPSSARVRVTISAEGVAEDQLKSIVAWAHDHCPVADAIVRAVPTTVEVTVG
jgi:uncharacterized OsmC-like protein